MLKEGDFPLVTLGRLTLLTPEGDGEPKLSTQCRTLVVFAVLALARARRTPSRARRRRPS
jgi:hypothetical protein